MSDYRPIPCHLYDELEILAMRKKLIDIEYREGDRVQTAHTFLKDLYTRSSVEYARLGSGEEIRLDALLRVDGREMPDFNEDNSCNFIVMPPEK